MSTVETRDGRTERVSGVANLSYVVPAWDLARDFAEFYRLTEFKRAALLLDERIAEGIPDIRERLRTVTREHGLEFELVLVGDDVQASILGFPRNDHRSRRRRFPGGSRAEPTRPRRNARSWLTSSDSLSRSRIS